MTVPQFVSEFLTLLELREAKLIDWGYYNVRWTVADVESEIIHNLPPKLQSSWADLSNQGITLPKLIEQMRRSQLVYLLPNSTDTYRTRFAEGIRLMSNLRQLFDPDEWATGPRLVSDLRIHIASRQYPRRDVSADKIWNRWQALCRPENIALQAKAFRALSYTSSGFPLLFSGFQERAFLNIFQKYGLKDVSGSVVCAGTGSGKTKAFYIPAFVAMVPELNDEPFTKIIAIYPRNVLLADQLREAISEANKLNPYLSSLGIRAVRFGALLGDTPRKNYFDARTPQSYHWKKAGDGTIIPYLKSPIDPNCDLIWRDDDRKNGNTRLFRLGQTNPDIESGVLAITREELIAAPPDVLFLSLEMLNREMGNPEWQRTLGIRQGKQSPRLLLLDEVHAYQGVPGAQVAWVLRRWRHWSRVSSLHVVGLSATLREAPLHLARIAAIQSNKVEEFRPIAGLSPSGEMEMEGGEYGIALKGDPAAGKALLATSIQAGMLLSRLLTPLSAQNGGDVGKPLRAGAFYGKKVFGFTDNLDSVNRWYSDMFDAEAHKHLAAFRCIPDNPIKPAELKRRHEEGQIWDLPIQIGHDLSKSILVTRTTAKDRGADPKADLIIATSALEVGYDDPDVGAVLHHKHPRSLSSFIQRKGRAGRTRGTRPWTVVVLSDYGTDRWYFQNVEKLFSPEIDPIFLPIGNPYVQRVQVAYFLLDWLGRKVHSRENIYQYLSKPSTYLHTVAAQNKALSILRGLVEKGSTWAEFYGELTALFRWYGGAISEEAAREILDDMVWHEPRPLLLQVIPNLLRKVEAEWKIADPAGENLIEDKDAKRPLPSYIPKATFSDIDFGEAYLKLPNKGARPREVEQVPVSLLLSEACPGRVSKRYADEQGENGFWHTHSPKLSAGENIIDVNVLFPGAPPLDKIDGIQVFYPERAEVTHRPKNCADSSNASWSWRVTSRVEGEGLPVHALNDPHLKSVFTSAKAFLHSNSEWLDILRYAPESRFDIARNKTRETGNIKLTCTVNGEVASAAVGFRCRVDGLQLKVSSSHLQTLPPIEAADLQRYRVDYFIHRVKSSVAISLHANEFQREWLAQTSLAMLTATALIQRTPLSKTQELLKNDRTTAAKKVLSAIFRFSGVSSDGATVEAKLQDVISDLWANSAVKNALISLEPLLWQPLDDEFDKWLRSRHVATLAQAFRAAMISTSSQVDLDDLAIDIASDAAGTIEILISETAPGGLGQVEGIVGEIQRDPLGFGEALLHCITECARQKRSVDLMCAIKSLAASRDPYEPLTQAAEDIRVSSGFEQAETAKNALTEAFRGRGFLVTREFFAVLMSRVLRPGTSSINERLMDILNRWWHIKSGDIGIAIPQRIFAYSCTRHPRTATHLRSYLQSIGGEMPSDSQLFGKLQQMLIENCDDCCPECLSHPGRFYDLGTPSRSLSKAWLHYAVPVVDFDSSTSAWIESARTVIAEHGRVVISCDYAYTSQMTEGLVSLAVNEVELSATRESVKIVRVERSSGRILTTLHLSNPTHV